MSASNGTATRLPTTTPSAAPTAAGSRAWATYARTTWDGVKPSAFRMPMRRVVEPTAPATTVPTISTDRRRLRPPNVSRNGTNSDVWSLASFFTTSHDRALVTAPSGSAAATASRTSPTCDAVPASSSRYSIW